MRAGSGFAQAFAGRRAQLLLPARAARAGLAVALRARPARRFEVQGHTDNVGVAELNRQLSQQRAEAVCLYFTAQLRAVGRGGTRPVADNAAPAQRPRNHRVVLRRQQVPRAKNSANDDRCRFFRVSSSPLTPLLLCPPRSLLRQSPPPQKPRPPSPSAAPRPKI